MQQVQSMKTVALLLTSLLTISCTSSNNAPTNYMDIGGVEAFQKPIDYIPSALGPHTWLVTTQSQEAQDFFKQGLQLRYAYVVNDAARSFRQATLADPQCAMCYWGEAFALGSFLNGAMSKMRSAHAHIAIEKAVALASTVTEVERDLIMAARDRYPADYDPASRRPVDEGFAERMKTVYAKYPGHQEVAVIYAVALFLLEERRGERDIADPNVKRLHGVLTGVLNDNIKHPGACHLYSHATESSQRPGLALACVDYLSDAIPIASHIQHMPSHTWNEVGYWGRSVAANTKAIRSDQMAKQNQGFSYGPSHNLHMLVFAASMDGQSAVAIQAGKDFAKLTGNNMYHALTLLRFGRFDEIAAVKPRPSADIPGSYWDFAQGYAALRNGDNASANRYLAKLKKTAAESTARFRFHKADQMVGLSVAILEGEVLLQQGDIGGAIESFRRAAELDDQQQYDEPEPIPYAARHWLGAALMTAEQYAAAEREYRTELADHPHNVWSLQGLAAALAAQGITDLSVEKDLQESTARMDFWMVESRY